MNELYEAGIGGLRLFALADKIIEDVEGAALDAAVILPSRRYAVAGEAVYDCEQVCLSIGSIQSGLPGMSGSQMIGPNNCAFGWMADMSLAIVRCSQTTPTARGTVALEKFGESLKVQSRDAEVLMDTLSRITGVDLGSVTGTITFPEHSGGMQATVLRITVGLP